MYNVQKHNTCNNIPSSKTFKSYLLAYVRYFEKIKAGLWDRLAVCIRPINLLNALTSLYETWYVYRGTWANLNGVFHKSHQTVCLYMYIPAYRC
jgi:hypothetical protein